MTIEKSSSKERNLCDDDVIIFVSFFFYSSPPTMVFSLPSNTFRSVYRYIFLRLYKHRNPNLRELPLSLDVPVIFLASSSAFLLLLLSTLSLFLSFDSTLILLNYIVLDERGFLKGKYRN